MDGRGTVAVRGAVAVHESRPPVDDFLFRLSAPKRYDTGVRVVEEPMVWSPKPFDDIPGTPLARVHTNTQHTTFFCPFLVAEERATQSFAYLIFCCMWRANTVYYRRDPDLWPFWGDHGDLAFGEATPLGKPG